MSKFVSHHHKNPVISELEELITLPVFSIIDVDGVLYEKTVTAVGATSTFIELGHTGAESRAWTLEGEGLKDSITEGLVKILRVGE